MSYEHDVFAEIASSNARAPLACRISPLIYLSLGHGFGEGFERRPSDLRKLKDRKMWICREPGYRRSEL